MYERTKKVWQYADCASERREELAWTSKGAVQKQVIEWVVEEMQDVEQSSEKGKELALQTSTVVSGWTAGRVAEMAGQVAEMAGQVAEMAGQVA
jgi:hypothetical protein